MIAIAIIFAIVFLFLASILWSFFFIKEDISTDNLLNTLQEKKGGELITIVLGRKMLKISTGIGEILIGYWNQRDVGDQMVMPYFTVRWLSTQPCDLPDFILREKKPLTGKFVVKDFQQSMFTQNFSGKTFMLFVKPPLNEREQTELNQRIAATLPLLVNVKTIVEIGCLNKALSCRYREAIMDVDQAELLMDTTLDFFNQLQTTK